ncbi:hypothetical protein [Tessaracoccus sp. OH4464_COT-324]|uniref:hypothetical protein n=1 Tax=Tessaracoccus sp. OH4464_COT-324 TaxID=2491059 RepID=UPI000F632916|nr:hypothetical protein [Tessaracoccus sp. OH4464_COT-324]RRD47160.1 hypothetical protein EII42_04045 [Tessaracoccus sp. OH4464_COT-324]
MNAHLKRMAAFAAAALLAGTTLTGCGSGGSAKAFCDTMNKNRESIEKNMDTSPESFGKSLEEGKKVWEELLAVAPDEIRSDVQKVSNLWQELETGMQNMDPEKLMNIGKGTEESLKKIGDFYNKNCSK